MATNPFGLLASDDELERQRQAALAARPPAMQPTIAAPQAASFAGGAVHLPGVGPSKPLLSATVPDNVMPIQPSGRGTLEGDKAERARLLASKPGESQIYSKVTGSQFGQNHPIMGKILGGLGQGLATAGDIGLSSLAPQVASAIPGTAFHHQALLGQANRAVTQDEASAEKTAQTGNLEAEAELRRKQAEAAELTPASQDEAARYGVPEGTPLNMATRTALAKQAGINETRASTNTETNETRKQIADSANQMKQDIAKLKPEQRDDRAIRLNQKAQLGEPLSADDQSYLNAYAKYIQQTKVEPTSRRLPGARCIPPRAGN